MSKMEKELEMGTRGIWISKKDSDLDKVGIKVGLRCDVTRTRYTLLQDI